MRRHLLQVATVSALLCAGGGAYAGDYSDASEYSHAYGMSAGQEEQPVNSSLRDSNGNLTVVNGQFTSSTMSQQSGVQNTSVAGSGASSGALFGGATAIGNSLNVVTVGNNNTVVVNSHQTNNGNQTATTTVNGH
jgi:holdfast attachment protein HfaA